MDKPILELLDEVSGVDLIFAILLIVVVIVFFLTQKAKVTKQLNRWREEKNAEEDCHTLVLGMKNTIDTLSKEMEKQSEAIAELKTTVLQIQEKNSETKRAEIKEKIERIYRECTNEQVCTETQFESLKDLIVQYEKHGGDNSFVHTTVQPEMYKWQIVKEVRKVKRD